MKLLFPIIISSLVLASCNKSVTETSSAEATTAESPTAESLDAFFVSAAPAEPQAIHRLRTTAVPGDEVTVSGRIMGRSTLFVENRAAFILGDPELLTPCNQIPDDECETPWDVCCDSKEDKLAGTATIQLVGSNGRVISQGLKHVHGLTELSTVTVTGTLDKSSTKEAMIINATALYVEN